MKSFKEYIKEAEMDPMAALQIFGLADFPKSEEELKRLYKAMAMQNHPDRGGSLEKMKDINAARDVLKKNIGRSVRGSFSGTRSGSMSGNARAYRQAGSVFRRAARPQKETPKTEEDIERELMHKKILNRIMKFFGELNAAAICEHLKKIIGQDFVCKQFVETNFSNIYSKAPWIEYEFANADRSIVFKVKLVGNSDGMAYRYRKLKDGAAVKDDFDFEWTYSVTLDVNGSSRQILTKATKCRAKDAAVLQTPEKLMSKAKVANLLGLSGGHSASSRKEKAVKAQKKDFDALFDGRLNCIHTGNWRFVPFKKDEDGTNHYIGIERTKVGSIHGWMVRCFARSYVIGKKTTMQLYGKELLLAGGIVPDIKDGIAFFENFAAFAKKAKNERKIAEKAVRETKDFLNKLAAS